MILSALVRDKQTKKLLIIKDDFYPTKAAFKKDLTSNGYTVLNISNENDLKAQNYGYKNLAQLKKEIKWLEKNGLNADTEKALLEKILGS